tara:strand:- start:219 stop:1517 length:1299 start_codon:yes stop_codon:yes gene_type:complete
MIVLKNFIFKGLFLIMNISCKINLPLLSACIIFLSLREMKGIKYGKITKKYIVLHKSVGIDDLKDSFYLKSSNFKFLVIKRRFIKIIYDNFVKNDHLKDYDYFTKDKKILKGQAQYNNFLNKVILKLQLLIKFDGFINFNIFYKAEVELQKVSSNLGLKFITIHKEALHPPLYFKQLQWIYKNTANKFYGTKVLTYNNQEKKSLVVNEIVPSNKIKVVGMPRLIKSLNLNTKSYKKKNYFKNIVLFTTYNRYLPYYSNPYLKKPKHKIFSKITDTNFKKIELKTFDLLKKLLEKENDVQLSIKLRTGFKENTNIFQKFGDRVKVITGGAGHELLANHGIVIGFNSTIVLESLAAGRITFCPFLNNSSKELFEFTKNTICSNSPNFLLSKLTKAKDGKLKISKKNQIEIKKALHFYLYNNDKQAGERLIKELN